MAQGSMSSNANYPSNSGIKADGAFVVGQPHFPRNIGVMNITGTPGSTAAYKAQSHLKDDEVDEWVDIDGASISGDGAAATGQRVFYFSGDAARIVADNGTSPGTGLSVPSYELQIYPGEPTAYLPC